MKNIKLIATVLGIAVFPLLTGGVALAQSEGHAVIEEITVTARKRPVEENMQDVAVAITAYSGATLDKYGIRDIREVAQIAPSLRSSQSQNSTTSSFGIRGIGTSTQNFGLESSVGIYVDGVYRARQSSVINNLIDMEAVEVLRGPQGTLFGRNTPSGALIFRTKAPSPGAGPEAFAEISAGDFGLLNVSGATSFTLSDSVAMRVTGFSGNRDGYVSDVALGSDEINDRSRWGGRLQLVYEPNDRFDMRIIADYSEIDEVCCAALTRLSNVVATGRDDGMGGPVFGSDALLLQLGGTVFPGSAFDDHTTALNSLPRSTNEDMGLSVEFNYDFENSTLTSISSYRSFDSTDNIDADFSDVALLFDTNIADQKGFTQEFRLSGLFGDSGSNYTVGAYYFTQDLNSNSQLDLGASTDVFLSSDPQLAALIAGVNAFSPPFPPVATAFPADAFANDYMQQEHDSWALFAQTDLQFNDEWMLTLGIRYTDEQKEMTGTFTNSPLGPPPDLVEIGTIFFLIQNGLLDPFDPANAPRLAAAFAPTWTEGWGLYTQPSLAPQANRFDEIEDDQITGTAKISYSPTDELMFYLSYGSGYKSGGTNTDRIDPAFSQVFDAETSTSIELGMKSNFSQNLQLNLAVHNTQVDDLQTSAFSGNGFNLQNAGAADTYGAEVDMWWTPAGNTEILFSYAWNVADFEDFDNGTCWVATPFHTGNPDPGQGNPLLPVCDRNGDRIPDNPEHSAFVGATQFFDIGSTTSMFVRAEFNYLSDVMTDGNNDPLKLRDSFTSLNLRVGFNFESIAMELTVWGRNVTDERFYETIFDVPVQGGKLNAYPHEPRTWGVTLRKSFD
jgi:iron complex outermembrane receptor protein